MIYYLYTCSRHCSYNILPPDGDHGNEEEETNGAQCNVLNLESDTTSNRRRQSWANAHKRKQSIISENGGYKRKQSVASVLSECLHVDIGEGHSKLNYRISQNPPFHLTQALFSLFVFACA